MHLIQISHKVCKLSIHSKLRYVVLHKNARGLNKVRMATLSRWQYSTGYYTFNSIHTITMSVWSTDEGKLL